MLRAITSQPVRAVIQSVAQGVGIHASLNGKARLVSSKSSIQGYTRPVTSIPVSHSLLSRSITWIQK